MLSSPLYNRPRSDDVSAPSLFGDSFVVGGSAPVDTLFAFDDVDVASSILSNLKQQLQPSSSSADYSDSDSGSSDDPSSSPLSTASGESESSPVLSSVGGDRPSSPLPLTEHSISPWSSHSEFASFDQQFMLSQQQQLLQQDQPQQHDFSTPHQHLHLHGADGCATLPFELPFSAPLPPLPSSSSPSSASSVMADSADEPTGKASRKRKINTSNACESCYKAKAACDSGRPCARCVRLGKADCSNRVHKAYGRPRRNGQQTSTRDSQLKELANKRRKRTKKAPAPADTTSTSSSSNKDKEVKLPMSPQQQQTTLLAPQQQQQQMIIPSPFQPQQLPYLPFQSYSLLPPLYLPYMHPTSPTVSLGSSPVSFDPIFDPSSLDLPALTYLSTVPTAALTFDYDL